MLKRQLSYFHLEECMREKDREGQWGRGGETGGGDAFCTASFQGFQKQAQPQPPISLARVLLMLQPRGSAC